MKQGGIPTKSRIRNTTNQGSPAIRGITRNSRIKGGFKMWKLFDYVFGFFNTDGTPMMPNSPTDMEGKLFAQSSDDNSSLFTGGWGHDSHGGGLENDF